jgi:hypothetical protein
MSTLHLPLVLRYKGRSDSNLAPDPIIARLSVLLVAIVCFYFSTQAATPSFRTIDLKPYCNFTLTNSLIATGSLNGANNLSALPAGVNNYAGIPFDVSGVIQLASQQAVLAKRTFPDRIEGIKVGVSGSRIHILHSAGWNDLENNAIASLVLHYADGDKKPISIIYGAHVLDWWVNDETPTDPGTTIAWTGNNRVSKLFGTDLRLYRTTFTNPKPTVMIDRVDFVSNKKEAAPFLLGITVD